MNRLDHFTEIVLVLAGLSLCMVSGYVFVLICSVVLRWMWQ